MERSAAFQEIVRLGEKYSASEVALFGSRAKGTAREDLGKLPLGFGFSGKKIPDGT